MTQKISSPIRLKVRELKKILADWPETDEDGELTEVWIETGKNMSSAVVEVLPLNKADIIFISGAFT